MIERIEEIILQEKPEGVLVYGDTNSTLAGALAASKLHIPVFHVEAGLRSYNKLMPEEQNRVLTDHISDLLLCPTQTAVENLKKEGVVNGVYNTGDIMYDAVLRNINISKDKYSKGQWVEELEKENGEAIDFREKEYYLSTIHRAENTDESEKLRIIFSAFNELDMPVLLPLHPRTRKIIKDLNICLHNIKIIEPVGYLLMLYLTSNGKMVVTDSGGLQKEAYFLDTPCTTLRDQTEWVETLENGRNILSKIEKSHILNSINRCLIDKENRGDSLFGDGKAAKHICEILARWSNFR